MTQKEKDAKRKELNSLALYLIKSKTKKAEKLQYRQAKRDAKEALKHKSNKVDSELELPLHQHTDECDHGEE